MKQIKLNNKTVNVFAELSGGRAQIAPNCTQINVGTDMPSTALTIPSWWWNSDQKGSIYTSGNTIEKI